MSYPFDSSPPLSAVIAYKERRTPDTPELKAWWDSGERVGATANRVVLWLVAAIATIAGLVTAAASYHRRHPLRGPAIFMVNPVRLAVAGGLVVAALALAIAGYWRYGATKADFVQRYQRQRISTAIENITTDPS
jgi:hypothetical protein